MFITAHKGHWIAYRSRWSWMRKEEPVLRAKTWQGLVTALNELGVTR